MEARHGTSRLVDRNTHKRRDATPRHAQGVRGEGEVIIEAGVVKTINTYIYGRTIYLRTQYSSSVSKETKFAFPKNTTDAKSTKNVRGDKACEYQRTNLHHMCACSSKLQEVRAFMTSLSRAREKHTRPPTMPQKRNHAHVCMFLSHARAHVPIKNLQCK